jgi:5'-deoxynucleotidase YfbR-like HD superfamily hydrolase
METADILNLLLHGNQLKRTTRTGWFQRGIVGAENVAAHSYGVAFIALVMAEALAEPLDLAAVLAMALLHDLPEALTSDIPAPAWRFLPKGIKFEMEKGAMDEILDQSPVSYSLMSYWEELHTAESAESRLVHDCDKLDLYLQALMYERQTGNHHLAEFWEPAPKFSFEESQAVFIMLARLREQE